MTRPPLSPFRKQIRKFSKSRRFSRCEEGIVLLTGHFGGACIIVLCLHPLRLLLRTELQRGLWRRLRLWRPLVFHFIIHQHGRLPLGLRPRLPQLLRLPSPLLLRPLFARLLPRRLSPGVRLWRTTSLRLEPWKKHHPPTEPSDQHHHQQLPRPEIIIPQFELQLVQTSRATLQHL